MKFCAKIGSFILGIIIGIVLVFGGVGLAGYIVLTKEGMVGTISEKVEVFNPSDEVKEKSILEYGKNVFETIAKFGETTFGTLEDTIGINITNTLADAIGLDAKVLRESTVSNVADNILNGYTITSMQDRFGLTLPDIPMFKDEEFLKKPIKDAFNYLSEQLNFDTMTVRELNEKFGVELGGTLSDEEFLDTPINKLGEKIDTMPLHKFVDVTLQVQVDQYLWEHVATSSPITGVTYQSLEEWKEGKTPFVPADDDSNYGVGSEYVFDNPADFLYANVYFADVLDGDGNVIKTAREVQTDWLNAYNATEGNESIVEFWQYAIEYKDVYDAATSDNATYLRDWTYKQWQKNKDYVTEDDAWLAWVATQAESGKTPAELKDVYYETVMWLSTEAEEWKDVNPEGTMTQYKEYLFDSIYGGSLNYYDYMPSFVAPIAPTVVVSSTEGKEASTINNEFAATIPVASNRTLQYLYYAVIGSDGENGLNTYMNNMTLDDATEIKETDHVLLQRIKHEKIANLGTAVTQEVDNMALNELMTIITDAEADYLNGNYVAVGEKESVRAEYDLGNGVYDGVKATWDYFETRADQQAWIEAQANATPSVIYYDELAWRQEMVLSGTRVFETEANRYNAYLDYKVVNRGDGEDRAEVEAAAIASYDAEKDAFGVVAEAVNFAKPYLPEEVEGYVKAVASSKMLQAISSSTPKTLNDDIASITLLDVFGEQSTGAMSLVSGQTKLDNVSREMTYAMQTATMGKLIEVGILTNVDFTGLTPEQVDEVKVLTIEGMVNAYINSLKAVTP